MRITFTCLISFAVTFGIAVAAFVPGCATPSILGGPTGPADCPNGTIFSDGGSECCPSGAIVTPYGKCEADPPAPSPTWSAGRHAADAGG